MKEKIISFETAKLAKEKGFNEYCFSYYDLKGNINHNYLENGSSTDVEFRVDLEDLLDNFNRGTLYHTYSAPTQSLLQRWLDITYNKYVHVEKHTRNGLKCYSPFIDNIPVEDNFFNDFDKLEEALEVGLYECLKLIPNNHEKT